MKATGIVRPIDSLGRVVLPIELRKILDINKGDSLEIFVEDSTIVLRKYAPSCIFCEQMENVITFKGKNVCKSCIDQMRTQQDG